MSSSGKKTRIKGVPPRLLLRDRDVATGSYPTIARTGDERLGSSNTSFNDQNTIIFDIPEAAARFLISFDSGESIFQEYTVGYGSPKVDLSQNYPFLSASADLVAHYRFEGDFSDETGGADSSTQTGVDFTTNTPFPASKKACTFNGVNASVNLSNDSNFTFGNGTTDSAFSVCAWIYMNDPDDFPIMGKYTSGGDEEWRFGVDSSETLFLTLFDGASTVFRSKTSNTFEMERYRGQWIHVACTYDGRGGDGTASDVTTAGITLYINGETVENTGFAIAGSYTAMEATAGQATIGNNTASSTHADGFIDELCVYSKELSQNEIRAIMGYSKGLSMPSLLPAGSPYLTEEMTSSFFISGTVKKGIADSPNFVHFTPGEDLTPFNESYRPEQSQNSNFFLTGSPPAESAPGFSSRLASKTQLRYTFNVATEQIMEGDSGSCYYFNLADSKWELAGGSDALGRSTSTSQMFEDARLFNAIGQVERSGSLLLLPVTEELQIFSTMSVQLTGSFEATASQLLTMDDIQHPFLLEKMSWEIPFKAGGGWFEGITVYVEQTFGLHDMGGPCITAALMRQDRSLGTSSLNSPFPTLRELITSATIIPENDNQSLIYGGNGIPAPGGFLSYGTPTVVVTPAADNTYTGSVVLNADCTIGNGMLGAGSNFGNAKLSARSVNPFGRRHGNPSARSLFGKEFTYKSFTDPDETAHGFVEADGIVGQMVPQFNHAYSPYLLFPGDELLLAIAKFRPALANPFSSTALTGSHDVVLTTGTMNLTLYGSLVRNCQEFHDTLNQPLNSLAIHEAIHYDNPVVDQFDVHDRNVFSGTYVDDIVEGLLNYGDTTTLGSINRFVKGSSVGDHTQTGVTGSLLRGVRVSTISERFFDTMPPDPVGIAEVDGTTLIARTAKTSGGSIRKAEQAIMQIGPGDPMQGTSGVSTTINKRWAKAFPFEAHYAGINRQVSTIEDIAARGVRRYNTTVSFVGPGTSFPTPPDQFGEIIETKEECFEFSPAFTMARNERSDTTLPYENKEYLFQERTNNIHVERVADRAMYGIGDRVITGSTDLDVAHGMPEFRFDVSVATSASNVELDRFRDCLIRGWKYGLMSALPVNSSAVFRRDRFGQFRDMLEQRLDSKMFVGETVRSAPVQVVFETVDGELSFSSNVSNEATSSVPYFDGQVRNRGALPETEFVVEP